MSERIDSQDALPEFAAMAHAAPSEVASIALEHKGNGRVIVYLMPGADEEKWKRVAVAKFPYANRMAFQRVAKSAAQLQARADDITGDLAALKRDGLRVTGVRVDIQGPPALVISQPDADQSQRDKLARRYPDATFEVAVKIDLSITG